MSVSVYAQQPLEYRDVFAVQERITRQLYAQKGVNGVHIIKCDPVTRERVEVRKGVWCFLVTTGTEDEALSLVSQLKAQGSMAKEFSRIPFTVKAIGFQRPQ